MIGSPLRVVSTLDVPRPYTLIANRASIAANAKSDGVLMGSTYRFKMFSTKQGAANGIRLVYANVFLNATGEEDGNTNNISVKASIEVGSVYRRAFFRGARTVSMEPGGHAISDPIGISIPANTGFWVRTYVSVGIAGDKWANSFAGDLTNLDESRTASLDDQADGTGILNNDTATTGMFTPTAVLGLVETATPYSVAIVGDSIGYGQNDTAEAPTWDRGWAPRVVNNKVGSVRLTRASLQLGTGWVDNASRRMALLAELRPTHCLCELGVNDITTANDFNTVQSRLLSVWGDLAALGMKVYGVTFTPNATSTDSWATLGNQTAHASTAVRASLNDWVRSVPSPLSGYLEIADVVESARGSGKWKVDGTANKWTADGGHPSQYAHQQVAAALSLNQLGIPV